MSCKIITQRFAVLICWLATGWSSMAQAPQTRVTAASEFATVVDKPGLPRVLLIGDSISMGYTVPVQKRLEGKANVHRIPENGGPTTNGLAKMKAWLGEGKWDVVHFNFGLHDLRLVTGGQRRVPVAEYERNLRQLARVLKGTGAKLIWASTTPVPGPAAKLGRITEDVPIYNAAARRVMEENAIPTDDLYAVALAFSPEMQRHENVHFTSAGSEALAEKVAATIEAALPKKD